MEAKVEKTEEPLKPVQPVILNDIQAPELKEETLPETIPQGKSFTLRLVRSYQDVGHDQSRHSRIRNNALDFGGIQP